MFDKAKGFARTITDQLMLTEPVHRAAALSPVASYKVDARTGAVLDNTQTCLLYTSPSPRD